MSHAIQLRYGWRVSWRHKIRGRPPERKTQRCYSTGWEHRRQKGEVPMMRELALDFALKSAANEAQNTNTGLFPRLKCICAYGGRGGA